MHIGLIELTATVKKTARKRPRSTRFLGDEVKSLVVRVRFDERDRLFKDAGDGFRTINAHILYKLQRFFDDKSNLEAVDAIKEFNKNLLEVSPETFSARLSLDLHSVLKSYSEDVGLSMNAVIRFALFGTKP